MDKISYRVHEPERFDIIVFPPRNDPSGKNYIKRIIGLPGETVRIDREGNIYINDEILNETYGLEVIEDPGIAGKDVYLGYEEYFVLGDTPANSEDSRSSTIGVVKSVQIIGKAWLNALSVTELSIIR